MTGPVPPIRGPDRRHRSRVADAILCRRARRSRSQVDARWPWQRPPRPPRARDPTHPPNGAAADCATSKPSRERGRASPRTREPSARSTPAPRSTLATSIPSSSSSRESWAWNRCRTDGVYRVLTMRWTQSGCPSSALPPTSAPRTSRGSSGWRFLGGVGRTGGRRSTCARHGAMADVPAAPTGVLRNHF